jgi:hypothetical protein
VGREVEGGPVVKALRYAGILLAITLDAAALIVTVLLGIKEPAFWLATWFLGGLTFTVAALFHNFTPIPPQPQRPVIPTQRTRHSESWREYFQNGGQL